MARGTPSGFKTTITGTNNVQDLYTEIRTRMEAYQSNGQDAWEMIDEISASAGSRNHVYQSKGDRTLVSGVGDANLIVELIEGSNYIYWHPYQDWSDDSSTGSRETGGTQNWTGAWGSLSSTADTTLWGVSNEYGFAFVVKQSTTYNFLHCGSPLRTHVPPVYRGVAFTTAQACSGSSVVLSVDRDLTSTLQVGQKIWTQQVTPTATALRSATIELPTVEAVTVNSVTIDTLNATLESGAIIGLDPTPFGVSSRLASTAPTNLYMTNDLDGTYTSALGQIYTMENMLSLTTEGDHDPSVNTGLYYGAIPFLEASAHGMRGSLELHSVWSEGAQSDGDRMIVNYDTAQAWSVFPVWNFSGGWTLAIGPGMPV